MMRLMVMSLTILGCFLAFTQTQPIAGTTRQQAELTRFFLTCDAANRT